jgi:hypothetical protein
MILLLILLPPMLWIALYSLPTLLLLTVALVVLDVAEVVENMFIAELVVILAVALTCDIRGLVSVLQRLAWLQRKLLSANTMVDVGLDDISISVTSAQAENVKLFSGPDLRIITALLSMYIAIGNAVVVLTSSNTIRLKSVVGSRTFWPNAFGAVESLVVTVSTEFCPAEPLTT